MRPAENRPSQTFLRAALLPTAPEPQLQGKRLTRQATLPSNRLLDCRGHKPAFQEEHTWICSAMEVRAWGTSCSSFKGITEDPWIRSSWRWHWVFPERLRLKPHADSYILGGFSKALECSLKTVNWRCSMRPLQSVGQGSPEIQIRRESACACVRACANLLQGTDLHAAGTGYPDSHGARWETGALLQELMDSR